MTLNRPFNVTLTSEHAICTQLTSNEIVTKPTLILDVSFIRQRWLLMSNGNNFSYNNTYIGK